MESESLNPGTKHTRNNRRRNPKKAKSWQPVRNLDLHSLEHVVVLFFSWCLWMFVRIALVFVAFGAGQCFLHRHQQNNESGPNRYIYIYIDWRLSSCFLFFGVTSTKDKDSAFAFCLGFRALKCIKHRYVHMCTRITPQAEYCSLDWPINRGEKITVKLTRRKLQRFQNQNIRSGNRAMTGQN